MPLPVKIILNDFIWRRKWWVMYLIVAEKANILEQLSANLDRTFEDVTFRHVRAYIEEGKMPPADIAPAILNMADDYLAGRQVAIRAGDYLMIQNHIRKGGKETA